MKQKVLLWGPVLVWCAIIFYFSNIPYLRISMNWWDYPVRKVVHMVEFGILARLISRALNGSTPWNKKTVFAWSLALTLLYAASDEYHQTFIEGRVGNPKDLLFDITGAWLALGLKP